jgi:sec-independent protein translocase protein TatC
MPAALSSRSLDPQDDDSREGRMGFLEHLDELRKRIIRACLAIAAGMVVAFFFVDRIGDFILAPTLKTLPAGDALIFTRPGEGIAFYLDVAFIGGVVLSAPFVMYQVWRFIAPGLYAKEKKLAIPFVLLTTAGSIGGALFTHYFMFPATIAFLATFHSPTMKFMPRVEDTFEVYKMMVLGMVAVFQIPTLVFFLAKMRLVTARFLWRHTNYAILVIFIVAAVLTPSTDPWNQTLFAAPMFALYLISIGIAWLVGPKAQPETQESGDSTKLQLVITAAVLDQARKHRARSVRDVRRNWGGTIAGGRR